MKTIQTATIALFLITALAACGSPAVSAAPESFDFVQHMNSGSVTKDTQSQGYMLSFTPSSLTTWFSEANTEVPGGRAGTMYPYSFFGNFTAVFGEEVPNAVLAVQNAQSELVSYAVEISSPTVDYETGQIHCTIYPLSGASADSLSSLQALGAFGLATLYIDSGSGEACSSDSDCDGADLYCNVILNICMDSSEHGNNGAACTADRDCFSPDDVIAFCADNVCTSVDLQTEDGGQ